MNRLILFILMLPVVASHAQDHGFPFGRITYAELNDNVYEPDTSAVAVVLDEFGEAYIDNYNDHNLIFEHHLKLKILRKRGLSHANYSIPLLKFGYQGEVLRSVEASSFNLGVGGIVEQKISNKDVYTEQENEYLTWKKFAIPNVLVGSIIEVKYVLESPYIFNFRRWQFQDDIPKVRSEYWATIPGNYNYNIALKGYLKLSKNDSELIKDCFAPGGGGKADCSRLKFTMENIPAFIEEEYMTASSNFISSINFELAEVKHFSGSVDKITKEWKDVEEELRRNQSFGIQLKRGKDIMDNSIELLIQGEVDPLNKARKIYDFIKNSYRWNGDYSKYCDVGIKKAFDSKTGNVGDINLSLIAALRYAGLDADPLILSTREHGIVTELYPVLSEFNYVVARLIVNDKTYLLDATDKFIPFGTLPTRCLNGKGRVIGDRKTSWQEIVPGAEYRENTYIQLKVTAEGLLEGIIKNTYMGYDAIQQRKKIHSFNSIDEYSKDLERSLKAVSIKKLDVQNLDDIDEALTETIELELEGFNEINPGTFLFNPFLVDKWDENPFRSSDRLYPVDFAAPVNQRIVLNLEYPENMEADDLPEPIALALPNNGGRYILSIQNLNHQLAVSSWLVISRTLYSSEEYHYLKELFNRIVQSQNTDIVFKKK